MTRYYTYYTAVVISTFFFLGKVPVAPGTFGAAGGVLLILLIGNMPISIYALFIFGLCILGFWSILVILGKTDIPDPQYIVIDEVIGQAIAAIPLISNEGYHVGMYVLSFLLFRLFDILKPWPICWIDQQTYINGISKKIQAACIIGDDVLAGLATWGCLTIFIQYLK